MLRTPGTINFKTEEKPICEILEYVNDDIWVKNPFGFQLAGVVVNDSVTGYTGAFFL